MGGHLRWLEGGGGGGGWGGVEVWAGHIYVLLLHTHKLRMLSRLETHSDM